MHSRPSKQPITQAQVDRVVDEALTQLHALELPKIVAQISEFVDGVDKPLTRFQSYFERKDPDAAHTREVDLMVALHDAQLKLPGIAKIIAALERYKTAPKSPGVE